MAQHLESNFSIRNLLVKNNDIYPVLTPPPSDGSISPNNSISSSEEELESRPNFTYSALVAMAIRSSPEGKLTLNAIQNWISDNFPYYRKDEQGWQNQIRQTLSTNSCFHKIPRPMSHPGRGNYWAMSSGLPAVGAVGVGNGNGHEALVSGVRNPLSPNEVYFPTPQEVHYHQQQTQLLRQQLAILQRQQIQQQHQEIYHKLAYHQQQIAFPAAYRAPV